MKQNPNFNQMRDKRLIKLIFTCLIITLLLIAVLCLFYKIKSSENPQNIPNGLLIGNIQTQNADDCTTSYDSYELKGDSLKGLIESGSQITIANGYYKCHKINRDEVVAYNYAGNKNYIVKIIKAIPGDSWGLVKSKDDYYLILVNGNPISNTQGANYLIPANKINMLKLYQKDYPLIPPNSYLILGNQINGTLDSTHFGLIGKNDIVGKVIY